MTDRTTSVPNWPYPFDRAHRVNARRSVRESGNTGNEIGDSAIDALNGGLLKLGQVVRFASSNIAKGALRAADVKTDVFKMGNLGDEFKIVVADTRAGELIKLSRITPIDPSTIEHKFNHTPGNTIRAVDSVTFLSPGKGKILQFAGAHHHLQSTGFIGRSVVDSVSGIDAVFENGEMFGRLIEEHAADFLSQIADINGEDAPSIAELERALAVGSLLLDTRDVLEDPVTSFGTEDELTARLGAVTPWDEKCPLEMLVDVHKMRLDGMRAELANVVSQSAVDRLVGPAFD